MLTINGFSSWIKIDGAKAQVYDVDADLESNQISCWVASEAGKAYEVEFEDKCHKDPVIGTLYVDGNDCGGWIIDQKKALNESALRTFDGILTSATTIAPFKFSTLDTTDEDLNTVDNPNVGEIKVVIARGEITGESSARDKPAPKPGVFHETSKKGFHHQTSFGEAITIPETYITDFEEIGEPVATFMFKYRPLAILQANGIAPKPVSVPTNEHGRKRRTSSTLDDEETKPIVIDLDDDSAEEAERLQELQKQMDTIRAKQQNRKKGESSRKKAKMEERDVKPEILKGVTIDLTLDDD
ncbi:hypothetical protein VNI00_013621 [Paramarasmius palmivorus]|uniref:DUF7918 domain-containing protein n=1 Tax=Paramarasmius palmivorus TaxID=297713 RepID=A0AAW0BWE8_9AGAR